MSIFDLPYEEYIKAQEEIMKREAQEERDSELVISKLVGRIQNFTKRSKWTNYITDHGTSRIWWQGVWKQQYEIQGGVVCTK